MNVYDFPFGLTKTDQLGLHVASLGALHVGSCDILIMSGECSDLDAEIGVKGTSISLWLSYLSLQPFSNPNLKSRACTIQSI